VAISAKGKTVTGHTWTYVHDDRPLGGRDPLATAFHYSRSRAGEHPQRHFAGHVGLTQADAFDEYTSSTKPTASREMASLPSALFKFPATRT
jgi:transposase